MKRNTMLAIVALLVIMIGGAGVTYWAYKKYKAKQNQEFRYEGKMGKAKEGFDVGQFKEAVLSEDVLDNVIEKHQLVSVWGVADAAAAKEIIRKKFIVSLDVMEVKVSYQDHDQVLAKEMLQSIVSGYYEKARGITPPPPSQ